MKKEILYHLFNPDDLLVSTVQKIVSQKKIKRAVVLSFLGSAKNIKLSNLINKSGDPDKKPINYEGVFEIVSVSGHVIPLEDKTIRTHIHITFSDEDGNVFGGHLDEATLYTGGYLFLEIMDYI